MSETGNASFHRDLGWLACAIGSISVLQKAFCLLSVRASPLASTRRDRGRPHYNKCKTEMIPCDSDACRSMFDIMSVDYHKKYCARAQEYARKERTEVRTTNLVAVNRPDMI